MSVEKEEGKMAEDGERTAVDDSGSQDEKEDIRNDGNYLHYFHR